MTTLLILALAVASTVHCGIVKRQIPGQFATVPFTGETTAFPIFPGQPVTTGFGGESTVLPGVSGIPGRNKAELRRLEQIAQSLVQTIERLQEQLIQYSQYPFVQQIINFQLTVVKRMLEAVNQQITQLGGSPVPVPSVPGATGFPTTPGLFPAFGSSTVAPVTGFPVFPTASLPFRV